MKQTWLGTESAVPGQVQACKSRAVRRWGCLLGERCLSAGCPGQLWRELVGPLPGLSEVRTAEMPVRRGLPVDRLAQLEALDDRAGPEVEVLSDELADRHVRHIARAEGLDVQRDRPGATDDVCDLHFEAIREAGLDDVLRDKARRVRGGPVDLRRVLPAERAAAVSRVAPIGVDDDLASGEAGVAHGTADRERAGPIHAIDRLRVEPALGYRRLDHDVADLRNDAVVDDVRIVLSRDDDRVHALRNAVRVLHGHLTLSVGPKPREAP